MDTKKSHEVDIMSYVCVHLFKSTGCQLTVDVGSGKGYLGQNLSLQHKVPVIGIDSVSSNSVAASKRLDSIGKQWEGISRNLDNEQKGIKLTKKQKKELKSKQKLHSEGEKSCGIQEQLKDEKMKSLHLKKLDSSVKGTTCSSEGESESKCDPSVKHGSSKCPLMIKSEDLNSDCGSYVPLTMFVNTETDLKAIAKESFPFLLCDNSVRTKLTVIPESESCDKCEHLIENNSAGSNAGFNTDLKKYDKLPAESGKTTRPHTKTKKFLDCDKKYEQDVDDIGIMLTGLHTCGDLASSMLELFVTNSDIKSLCSVGCCYHLLSEEFDEEELNAGNMYGFPKSSYLKEKRVVLGNTARNLASQALHRMSSFEKLQGYRFFTRALLQKIIEDVVDPGSVKWTGLRKLEQRSSGIKDYIQKACRKLGIPDELRLKNRLFVAWTAPTVMDCKMIGPETQCFCQHRFHQHKTDFEKIPDARPILLPCKIKGCGCRSYHYVPLNGSQPIRCSCKHYTDNHTAVPPHKCKTAGCKCDGFKSSYTCGCGQPYNTHHMIVETKDERQARGNPIGHDVPYQAMDGLTGFSSLMEGYMSLDPSGIGAPPKEFLEQPITASDHPFLRANVESIKAHNLKKITQKGESSKDIDADLAERMSAMKKPGESDMDFYERRYQERQKAERDRARASRALPPGKLATGKRTSAPKK